ncbi:MAG: right-handed parallel beta-helix repeat-containing protein [Candidatus Bathyarchaeota archaeon]|nr:MAG: right-handed parallel beta-helix repeat-containing protein [Candidatus Bathyarchaeota archaeon]
MNSINDHPVHNLNTGMGYASIREAINANQTSAGHTIYVKPGIYFETIELNKVNLALIGENYQTTIIDGQSNGKDVVTLKANGTTIEGFTVRNGYYGVTMSPWTHGHIIAKNVIMNNYYGVSGHYDCKNITISGNTIVANSIAGIKMSFSHSFIHDNVISANGKDEFQEYGSGIQITKGVFHDEITYCISNVVSANVIENQKMGISAPQYSEQNRFFHNNFVNNSKQLSIQGVKWNNTLENNYWSDFDGIDGNRNGIGDSSYIINDEAQDEHPLMGMFSRYIALPANYIGVVSNSTVEWFQYSEINNTIKLHVSNSSQSQIYGFCRMSIPHMVISEPYNVTINGAIPIYWNYTLHDNGTHRWIYFSYRHSELEIVIIPEFKITQIALFFLIFSIQIALVFQKSKN